MIKDVRQLEKVGERKEKKKKRKKKEESKRKEKASGSRGGCGGTQFRVRSARWGAVLYRGVSRVWDAPIRDAPRRGFLPVRIGAGNPPSSRFS